MSEAEDQRCQQAGIAENHLVRTLGGRVAFKRCANVGGERRRHPRQGLDEGQRLVVAQGLATGAGQVVAPAVAADGHGDLVGNLFVEIGGLLADVVFEVGGMQFGPGEIAGKENAAGLLDDLDDLFLGGNGDRADMFVAILGAPGGEQLLDDGRYLKVLAAVGDLDMIADGGNGAGVDEGRLFF